ncbi:MAG: tetratricopeptide repeat protein, partial [Chloroflexota bacterium]|nr:tetratricopeptide repeat protein [Chloroflexota bacterium]
LRRVGLVLLTLRRAGDALTPLERARELDPSDAAVCSLLGQIAEIQRDLHAAIQNYGSAAALEPENGRHHLRLGLALLNAGETEAALEHLGRSTELEPARAAAWTAYSKGLLRTRRIDRAYSAAQRAVQIAPTDGHAWRQLAAVAEARNDVRGALDALERAVALAPAQRAAGNRWQGAEEAGSSPAADRQMPSVQKEWLLYYGNLAIAHGETERGRIALQAASDLDPNDADLLHQLAQFHGSAERVALLQRAVALKPTEAAWRTELAELLVARGEHRPALDHLKQAIEAEPRRSAHWIALAHAYMEAGDDAAAEATLRRAEATVDPDAAIYVALGDLLSEQGRWDEALQAYIEAGRLAPSADYHTECGRCLQALGRFDEAREALEQALELEPTNARAATHLAEVHLLRDTQDGWKTAIKYARIATENAPGELAGYKVQARAALGGRWKDEVKSALEHAYAIAPDDPELHELQGWYYFHEGKNEIALLEAERAIEFDPESASAYYLQAQVLRRQQRFMEAIAALRTAVHLDRNFKEAIKELTALGLEALIHSGRK